MNPEGPAPGPPRVAESIADMRTARASLTGTVGLVPTMGYLHEGHLSLIRRSGRDNDHTVVSIFVNPAQFGPGEDLDDYPRDTERDLGVLSWEGVDIVFMPSAREVYPPTFDNWVEVHGAMTERLEGAHRPGHFRGVTTIVSLLFEIIRPDKAYFGQKDAQQLRIIRRMVAERELAVQIVGLPTVRDDDGLALSSRNVYLRPMDRRAALTLPRALQRAQAMVASGERDARAIRNSVMMTLNSEPRIVVDYVSVSSEETFEEVAALDRPALLLVAVRIGGARLIDNALLIPDGMIVPDHLRELVTPTD